MMEKDENPQVSVLFVPPQKIMADKLCYRIHRQPDKNQNGN